MHEGNGTACFEVNDCGARCSDAEKSQLSKQLGVSPVNALFTCFCTHLLGKLGLYPLHCLHTIDDSACRGKLCGSCKVSCPGLSLFSGGHDVTLG